MKPLGKKTHKVIGITIGSIVVLLAGLIAFAVFPCDNSEDLEQDEQSEEEWELSERYAYNTNGYIFDKRTGEKVIEGIVVQVEQAHKELPSDTMVVFQEKETHIYGHFNLNTGDTIMLPQFDVVWEFRNGIAKVCEGGFVYFVDTNYECINDFEYRASDPRVHTEDFSDIDYDGNWITSPQWPVEDNQSRKLKMEDNMDWIEPLQRIAVPDTNSMGDKINKDLCFYIRFDKPANGYEVTCRFFPHCAFLCLSGYLIMRFEGNGHVLIHREDKHQDWLIRNVRAKQRWHNNDVYELDYIEPDNNEDWRDSPLGYDTPFQFYDIDFDGEEELLTNDFYKGQGGNHYCAYKIRQGTSISLDDKLPFSDICNRTEIDPVRKTITIQHWIGASDFVDVRFVRRNKEDFYLTDIPTLRAPYSGNMVREELQEYISTPNIFAVDSISERFDLWQEGKDREERQDSVYEYKLRGKRLELVKSSRVKR